MSEVNFLIPVAPLKPVELGPFNPGANNRSSRSSDSPDSGGDLWQAADNALARCGRTALLQFPGMSLR